MKFLRGIALFFCAFFAIVLGFKIFSVPTKINMTEGYSQSMSISFPFSISTDRASQPVVSINNSVSNVEIQPVKSGNTLLKLNLFGLPVKDVKVKVHPQKSLCVVGKSVGICIDTKGVLVLGTGSVKNKNNESIEPSKNKLYPGDVIVSANGIEIKSKENLMNVVKSSDNLAVDVLRNEKHIIENIVPIKAKEDNANKIGVWVRDSTQGVGTLTYFDKDTKNYGALGHPIVDVDTGQMMSISSGKLLKTSVIAIDKGEKDAPGAIIGDTDYNGNLGTIVKNNSCGIYGRINNAKDFTSITMPVGYRGEVKKGEASILANIDGKETKAYKINIDYINKYSSGNSKGLVISVTDPQLLNKTGGIVQGLSGCPIIQNGKIIGAVTHVFVKDSKRGYGIFIENMLEQSENIS